MRISYVMVKLVNTTNTRQVSLKPRIETLSDNTWMPTLTNLTLPNVSFFIEQLQSLNGVKES